MFKTRLSVLVIAGLSAFFINVSRGVTFTEDFSSDPESRGWRAFGNTNLFSWDATNENLRVTWDSTNANSYFYRPIGTILAKDDDFSLAFDLRLSDVQITNYGFQLAIGLLNFSDATRTNFLRGSGNSPNLAEFDYFSDSGFGPSIAATLTDTNAGNYYFAYENLPLVSDTTYRLILTHAAGQEKISGAVFTNGQLYASLSSSFFNAITDFRLDTVSINGFYDGGFGDSILAHGVVDNFTVTTPAPPVTNLTGEFTNTVWQVQFISRSNWFYTLERTLDFSAWTNVSATISGNAMNLFLQDTNPPTDKAFYRVRAERP